MRTQSIAKQLHGPTGGVGLTCLEAWSASGNHRHAGSRRLSSTREMPQSIAECKAGFSGLGELQGSRDGEVDILPALKGGDSYGATRG